MKLEGRARSLFLGIFVTLIGLAWGSVGSAEAADSPAPGAPPAAAGSDPAGAAPSKPAYRVLVFPFWNLSGTELAPLESAVAKSLIQSSSKLAENPRLEPFTLDELNQILEQKATPAEREAFEGMKKRGDPSAALPLLTSIAKGAEADLVILGTIRKLGDGPGLAGEAEVDSWLLAKQPNGELEEPVHHQFRGTLRGSVAEFAVQVAQDDWWASSTEIGNYVEFATLHPTAYQVKFRSLKHLANKDRMQVLEEIFPEEFIHSQTCKITPSQMRDAALATDQLVQKLEPKNPRSHNYRGLVEYCGKNSPQALRYFEKASSLDATFPDAWYNAGSIYWDDYQSSAKKEDLDRAFDSFSKAVQIESGFAEARAKRGLAWLAKGDAAKADSDLTGAYREDRQNPDVLLGRCQLLLAAGKAQQAQDACRDAVRADSTLASAHKILGDLARDRKQAAIAIDAYRKAIEANPQLADAREQLIRLLFAEKRFDDAKEAAEAMIQAIPSHSVPHYLIGKICEDRTRPDLVCAEQAYQQAFQLDPNWRTLSDDMARVRKKRGGRPLPSPRTPSPATPAKPMPAAAATSASAEGGARAPKAAPPSTETRDEALRKEEFLRKYNATKGN